MGLFRSFPLVHPSVFLHMRPRRGMSSFSPLRRAGFFCRKQIPALPRCDLVHHRPVPFRRMFRRRGVFFSGFLFVLGRLSTPVGFSPFCFLLVFFCSCWPCSACRCDFNTIFRRCHRILILLSLAIFFRYEFIMFFG